MNVLDFYKKLLTSVGFIVKDGDILLPNDEAFAMKGIPYVLPTKENLKSILNPDGTVSKIIYNPLIEDGVAKKDKTNNSLKKTIEMGKLTLGMSIIHIGRLLMQTVEKPTGDFKLLEFTTMLADITKNKKIQKIVDDSTIKAWTDVVNNAIALDCEYPLLAIKQVKAGSIGKEKFNVVTNVYSPLLDYILDLKSKEQKITSLIGVDNLRPKDVDMIKTILSFLLNGISENKNHKLDVGSNSDSAGLDSFLKIYITLVEYFNSILESTKLLDKEEYEAGYVELDLSIEDLRYLTDLRKSALVYPTEKSLTNNQVEIEVPQHVAKPQSNSILDRLRGINTENENSYVDNKTTIPQNSFYDPRSNNSNSGYQPQQETSNINSIMNKIHGVSAPQQNNYNVPNINSYNGSRPDLHVSHLYNEAQSYNPRQHQQQQTSQRFNDVYVPLSEKMRQQEQRSYMYNRGGYGRY